MDPEFVKQFLRSLHVDDLNSVSKNIQDWHNFYNNKHHLIFGNLRQICVIWNI